MRDPRLSPGALRAWLLTRDQSGVPDGYAPLDGAGLVPVANLPDGGGAPTGANYLVGTANAGLSAEIAVGATPGGELGGTWASPTVDATHSGSTHAATQAAAEATAASALSGHTADTGDAHDASAISFTPAGTIAATNVQDALEEVAAEAGGGGGTSAGSKWDPDAWPASPGSEDDEYADAAGAGVPSGWTEVDHGSVQTVSEDAAGLVLSQASHAGDVHSGIYKAIPAGDFTYWTKVGLSGKSTTQLMHAGIALWQDATNSAGDLYNFVLDSRASGVNLYLLYWTSYTAFSAVPAEGVISVDVTPTHIYLSVGRTGTTYSFYFSTDGLNWHRLYSNTLSITPTHIGPTMNNGNATGVTVTARFQFWRYDASDLGITGLREGRRVALVQA